MKIYKVSTFVSTFQWIFDQENPKNALYNYVQEQLNFDPNQQVMLAEAIEAFITADYKSTVSSVLLIDSQQRDYVVMVFLCGNANMILAAIEAPDRFIVAPKSC